MKRFWWLILTVLVLWFGKAGPFSPMDAGEMCILETMFVQRESGQIRMLGKDVEGSGASFYEAYEDMADNAPGKLYLRQVRRVIFCGSETEFEDFICLPEDIPLGALIYRTDAAPETLMEQLDNLERKLLVEEKEGETAPKLAQLLNWELGRKQM